MTDLPDPLDELASAYLDGAATPEEAARVAGDPSLQARVAELRAARDALQAAAVPADPARREAAIAAAVAAFHEDGAEVARPPAVTSLAEVAARRRTSGVALRLLGAAAIIVLVALLVPLLTGPGDDDAETADVAREGAGEQESLGDAADGGSEAPANPEGDYGSEAAGGDVTTTSGGAVDDAAALGAFEDVDALAAAVRRAPGATSAYSYDLRTLGCAGARAPDGFSGTTAFAGTATLAGEPVEVVVTSDGGARTMTVVRAEGCTVLATREL